VLIENLPAWLKEGESERLAFRLSFGHETIETLVAFANSHGGVLLLGVSETREVKGIPEAEENIDQWMHEIHTLTAPHLSPSVEIAKFDEKTVVYLSVSEYPIKPVALEGKYYKRAGKFTHAFSTQEIVDFRRQIIDSHWDSNIRPGKTVADISFEKLYKLIERISSAKQCHLEEPFTFLRKYGLLEGDKITNACWLLFLPDEDQETIIELKRFSSPTVTTDTLTLKSDLLTEVEDAMRFICKHISIELETENADTAAVYWQYPLEAIRELVVNMIIHRDYTSDTGAIIKIFDNRIEFYNSGAFPNDVSVKPSSPDEHLSRLRNLQIAELFKDAGVFEAYGYGIRQIRTAFIDMGLRPPEFIKLPGRLIVRATGSASAEWEDAKRAKYVAENPPIYLENADDDDDIESNQQNESFESSSERERLILQSISRNNRIPLNEIAMELSVSKRTILRDIKKLKQDKTLERIGSEKNGFWKINLPAGQNE